MYRLGCLAFVAYVLISLPCSPTRVPNSVNTDRHFVQHAVSSRQNFSGEATEHEHHGGKFGSDISVIPAMHPITIGKLSSTRVLIMISASWTRKDPYMVTQAQTFSQHFPTVVFTEDVQGIYLQILT